jgi:phospholipase C
MGEGPSTAPATGRGRRGRLRLYLALVAVGALAATAAVGVTMANASTSATDSINAMAVPATAPAAAYRIVAPTATPIKHLVVIFDENESFDHYFGTYPFAANTDGNPFHAKPGTPTVNGLYTKITPSGPVGPLLTNNPNAYNPERLTPSEALTCDQDHDYQPEQQAFNGGKMNKFVQFTEADSDCNQGEPNVFFQPGLVMDYYDGNTVTALWNYAQNYAMSDNNYGSVFGPSTPARSTSSPAKPAAASRSARPPALPRPPPAPAAR